MQPPAPDDDLPASRPVPIPAEKFRQAEARLRRTAARLKLDELRAAGLTLRVDGGRLLVSPAARAINGTAVDLSAWRDRLIEVLKEVAT